jgi:hypothetical protein
LAGETPEAAVDAFVERFRRTLSCVVRGVAVASGAELGRQHSVTLYAEGQSGGYPARIRTHGGEGELLFQFAHLYHLNYLPNDQQRGPYRVSTTFYNYDILDRTGGEIVVYHWEPEGISPVKTPHLHVSAAAPVVLPQRPESALANRRTYLNKLHLLTGRILLEDVVEMLIREFAAVPLRPDWERVLNDNRAAINGGTTG